MRLCGVGWGEALVGSGFRTRCRNRSFAVGGRGEMGIGLVSGSGFASGVVGRSRAAYRRGEGGTCGVCSSAFVPLVPCSSVFASAVFCFLISFCGHGAYTQVKRRMWAVLLHCMRRRALHKRRAERAPYANTVQPGGAMQILYANTVQANTVQPGGVRLCWRRGQARPAHLVLRSSHRRSAGRTGRSLHR